MKPKQPLYYIDPKSEAIGDDILEFRILSGMTQWDLAGKIGTDSVTVSTWENYRHRPDVKSLHKINKFLAKYWAKHGDVGLSDLAKNTRTRNEYKEELESSVEPKNEETGNGDEEDPAFYEDLEKITTEKK